MPHDTTQSDWALLEQHHANDPRAFEYLVERWTPFIRRHLHRRLRVVQPADARDALVEDTLQEVWWRLYNNTRVIDPTKNFKAWLYTVATNLASNALRNRTRRTGAEVRWPTYEETGDPLEFEDPNPMSHADADLLLEERTRELTRIFGRLSIEQQEILRARDAGGERRSYAEIARRLSIPAGTVKSRISRARTALRIYLAQES